MNARELDTRTDQLRSKRRRLLESLPLGLACAGLAAPGWLLTPSLGIALAAGAAFQAMLAGSAFFGRRLLLEHLATKPEAHAIPEVNAFGRRLARPSIRRKLARSIRGMLTDVVRPHRRHHALFLTDRVYRYSRDLDAIARDLVSPSVRVDPVSMARCNWLLTQAAENPLFDRRLPAEDLGVILRRIRAGMEPVS